MSTNPHYDVFLSHNGADQADVVTLAEALRTQGHLRPFLDRWHLIPGMPWQEAIEAALAQSATVAVFFGPSGVSPWHNEQMRVALDEAVRTRDEVRVIPVLLPGATEAAVSRFLRLIRFSHTVFALPFALGALLVAANGLPSARTFLLRQLHPGANLGNRRAGKTFSRILLPLVILGHDAASR